MYEGRLREWGNLRGLFEETPVIKAGKASQMQVCAKELEFVVYPFGENFSSPKTIEDLVQTGDGEGELPIVLMIESNWDVNERMSNFQITTETRGSITMGS